jgi:hypothetical protein
MKLVDRCMRERKAMWIGVIAEESLGWLPYKTNTIAGTVGCLPRLHLSKLRLGSSMGIGPSAQKVTFEIAIWSTRNPPPAFAINPADTTRHWIKLRKTESLILVASRGRPAMTSTSLAQIAMAGQLEFQSIHHSVTPISRNSG